MLIHELSIEPGKVNVANLQIKGIDDQLYAQLGKIAAAEHRSISQQVLYLIKGDLARRKSIERIPTPAETLLELSGSWASDESAHETIAVIKDGRRNSKKLRDGF